MLRLIDFPRIHWKIDWFAIGIALRRDSQRGRNEREFLEIWKNLQPASYEMSKASPGR